MSDIANNDKPGSVAGKPLRYPACYRLIRPDQVRHLTNQFEALCEDDASSEGMTLMREDPASEVRRDRPLIQPTLGGRGFACIGAEVTNTVLSQNCPDSAARSGSKASG